MVSYAKHCDTVAKHGRSGSAFSPVEGLHYADRSPATKENLITNKCGDRIQTKASRFMEIASGSVGDKTAAEPCGLKMKHTAVKVYQHYVK